MTIEGVDLEDIPKEWYEPLPAHRLPDISKEEEERVAKEKLAETLEKMKASVGNNDHYAKWTQITQPLYDEATIEPGGVTFAPYILSTTNMPVTYQTTTTWANTGAVGAAMPNYFIGGNAAGNFTYGTQNYVTVPDTIEMAPNEAEVHPIDVKDEAEYDGTY